MFSLGLKRCLCVSALFAALASGGASAQSLKVGVLQCHRIPTPAAAWH
jgi:hypothetical protein